MNKSIIEKISNFDKKNVEEEKLEKHINTFPDKIDKKVTTKVINKNDVTEPISTFGLTVTITCRFCPICNCRCWTRADLHNHITKRHPKYTIVPST